MCTLVVAWQVFTDTPIAVAANRDELLDRPARPPTELDTSPRVVAPRDEEAGGTWIGYNEHRVLGAITNRWTGEDHEGERSRGLLVLDALGETSAESATRTIESELADRSYEPFNLLLADAEGALLIEWDSHLRVRTLDPGVHVVMNVGYDDTFDVPKRRRESGVRQIESARTVRATLQPEPDEGIDSWLDRAADVLGDHEYGVCIHGEGFGTRSASLIALGEGNDGGKGGNDAQYRYADGPPCRTEFETIDVQI